MRNKTHLPLFVEVPFRHVPKRKILELRKDHLEVLRITPNPSETLFPNETPWPGLNFRVFFCSVLNLMPDDSESCKNLPASHESALDCLVIPRGTPVCKGVVQNSATRGALLARRHEQDEGSSRC